MNELEKSSEDTSRTLEENEKKTSSFVSFAKRFAKSKGAVVGLILLVILVLLAIFSPWISPYGYSEMDMTCRLSAPSWAHPFGTDQLGRDLLSRILYGGRFSLSLGILAVALAAALSVILGSIAGFAGGAIDNLIMRIMDIIQSVPSTLLAIILSTVLGAGYVPTIIALAVPSISGYSRILRSQVMQVSENEFVEAATSLSLSKASIIFKHVLPNSWSPLIVSATMGVAQAILNASALSFIGLGVQSPTPEWGALLSGARDYMRDYPYMVIIPGLFIMVTVLSLNLIGDGVRDALDPKLKD